jgi:hypothetical protein
MKVMMEEEEEEVGDRERFLAPFFTCRPDIHVLVCAQM